MPATGVGRVSELEEAARRRFVRWDGKLWERLLDGPARRLAESLAKAGHSPEVCEAVLDGYLQLGVEGIGLGYVVPEESGAQTVATLLWTQLIPDGLAALPAAHQAGTLAASWNLAENLEAQPVWIRRVFLRALAALPRLDRLDSLVADVTRRLDTPPAKRLKETFTCRWVYLPKEDSRFLPGAVHFKAPAVACVHDRREEPEKGPSASLGVWLDGDPLLLGPLGCRETPAKDPGLRMELLEGLSRQDPRAADWHSMATNEWRGAVTLETSQFLVALYPV
jgi:hypothetical protein